MGENDNPGLANLISWWCLEEVAGWRYSAVSPSLYLVDQNGVTYSSSGIQGNAADLDDTDTDYLIMSSDTALLSMGDIDMTIGCWVKFESFNISNSLMSKWTSSDKEYHLSAIGVTPAFYFTVRDTGDSTDTSVQASSFGTPTTATWYFVIGWHDATNNVLGIEVNGVSDTNSPYTGGIRDGTAHFSLGSFDAGNLVDGLLDEAFVYKKVLTAGQRSWLYNGGNGRAFSEIGNAYDLTVRTGRT